MREKEEVEKDIHERTQQHLEKLRAQERAYSAERKEKEQEEKKWYQAKISIQE